MPLSPSDRVTLIKEIADRIAAEDWDLIDLILTQFGQPTSTSWNNTPYAYVVDKLQSAPE